MDDPGAAETVVPLCAAVETYAGRYGSPQNHKREGAVSVCRPMDATTIELPDLPIYAIEAGLGDHCGFGDRAVVDVDSLGRSVCRRRRQIRVDQAGCSRTSPFVSRFSFPRGQVSPCLPPCFSLLFLFGEIYLSP